MYRKQLYERKNVEVIQSHVTQPKVKREPKKNEPKEEVKKGGGVAEVKEIPTKIRNSDKLKKFIEINL